MGYSYRNNGAIKDFWPDDTEDTIYVSETFSLNEILDIINEKWPDIHLDFVDISSENIHTSCLTYDRHDPSDYTNFTVITRAA